MIDIKEEILGQTLENKDIKKFTLENFSGAKVVLINIGAMVDAIIVPDKDGAMVDVVLGYKDYNSYFNDGAALGKSVGRFANRIALGKFTLDGIEYQLATNNGQNHLHGGPTGFMNRVWDSKITSNGVIFTYTAQDGEEGYPGDITVSAEYIWTDTNELSVTYKATTTTKTIVNLTNHTYFNLDGESSGSALDNSLKLYAKRYLSTDETQIPTGEFVDVVNTPMDFCCLHKLGDKINEDFDALKIGYGYDHCWAIDNYKKRELKLAAELYGDKTNIRLKISTTQPGVQIYTGNWLDGCGVSKQGRTYQNRDGVAIECQNFPDAPNKPHFPSSVLEVGDVYEEKIIFAFGLHSKSDSSK